MDYVTKSVWYLREVYSTGLAAGVWPVLIATVSAIYVGRRLIWRGRPLTARVLMMRRAWLVGVGGLGVALSLHKFGFAPGSAIAFTLMALLVPALLLLRMSGTPKTRKCPADGKDAATQNGDST